MGKKKILKKDVYEFDVTRHSIRRSFLWDTCLICDKPKDNFNEKLETSLTITIHILKERSTASRELNCCVCPECREKTTIEDIYKIFRKFIFKEGEK